VIRQWLDPLYLARRQLWLHVRRHAHLASGRLLDVGCGGRPYEALFPRVQQYVGLELPKARRADVWGSALLLPFQARAFDTVLCNQVLEHVPEPAVLFAEVRRVLAPGGVLILTTPQTWGLHHEPHDFYRFTRYGLAHLARSAGLEVVASEPTCGFWATWAQRFADIVAYTYLKAFPRVSALAGLALAPVLLFGHALDSLFGQRGDTLDNILVARKTTEARP